MNIIHHRHLTVNFKFSDIVLRVQSRGLKGDRSPKDFLTRAKLGDGRAKI